jgi:predicted NBD/HSP70 family sugar kinase
MDTSRSILAHLRAQPASLADLAAATGASLPTVRRAVQDLVAARWIRAVGREEATGGRPATLFGLDDAVHTVIGVHLAHPGMRLVATDLRGRIVAEEVPELVDLDPDAVHAAVLAFLQRLRADLPGRRPLGVGVATPGYVDPTSGTVITIGRVPHWDNLPIRARLEEATGLPVEVGNDMDALATAEFGAGENGRTYAYVGFGEGIKFTLFLRGLPYRGPFGNAGLVSRRLLADRYGAERAALLEVHGLAEAHRRACGEADDASRGGRRDPAEAHRRFERLLGEAAEGRAPGARLVAEMSELLGEQIAALVHLVQPELLVVGGRLAGAPEPVRTAIEAAVRERLPTLLSNALMLRPARVVGEDATACGATQVFLHRALHDGAPAVAGLSG